MSIYLQTHPELYEAKSNMMLDICLKILQQRKKEKEGETKKKQQILIFNQGDTHVVVHYSIFISKHVSKYAWSFSQ